MNATEVIINLVDSEVDIGSEIIDITVITNPVNVEIGVPGMPGPIGPPGPPGSVLAYIYDQLSPNDIWIVNHNLGFKPHVEVYDVGSVKVEAAVIHISNNQTQILFSLPTAGFARLI